MHRIAVVLLQFSGHYLHVMLQVDAENKCLLLTMGTIRCAMMDAKNSVNSVLLSASSVPMCTTSLHSELLRLIREKKEKPPNERGKTHTFPADLYISPSSGLGEHFSGFLDDLITIPSPKQSSYREAYRSLYEQIILNLSRCVITRQWLCIAGSNSRKQKGKRKYGKDRCHIYKSEPRTTALLELLVENEHVIKVEGAAYDKGFVENHYFPTKSLANQLAIFAPFVEQSIIPSRKYLKINQPEESYKDFAWPDDHPDLQDIMRINEYAKHQSWTLKAPIRQTYNQNPFMVGRLTTPFQNLPTRKYDIRKNTHINGQPIAEVDFNANHLRIYLAYEGQPYSGADPYMELAKIAGVSRDDVKGFITVGMNCDNLQEAIGAALRDNAVSKKAALKVHRAFQERFRGIELYSGFGIYAMNYEGIILKRVILKAMEQDVFCLPIHDAVACEAKHSEMVSLLMHESWEQEIGHLSGGATVRTIVKVS